jgi:hypothetical protein
MVVPGILLVPKNTRKPVPAIIGLHGHGSSKESICSDPKSVQLVGPLLAKQGYVVAAIDVYFNGERIGKGPAGKLDQGAGPQEMSLFKLNLWLGRCLWGMMLRDGSKKLPEPRRQVVTWQTNGMAPWLPGTLFVYGALVGDPNLGLIKVLESVTKRREINRDTDVL